MVFEQTWSCPHYDDDFIGYGFSPIVLFSTNKSLAHLTDRIVEWINAGRVLVNGMAYSFFFFFTIMHAYIETTVFTLFDR